MPTCNAERVSFLARFPKRHKTNPSAKIARTMIQTLRENDILFGRGNGVAFFPGNINFRRIAWKYRDAYLNQAKVGRKALALKVMGVLINLEPPCRFLEPTESGYGEVSQCRVIEKICQTLREKKFREPEPQDGQKVITSFHHLTNVKSTKARRTKKPTVRKAKEVKRSKKVTQVSKKKTKKASPALVNDSEDEAPPSSPCVSRIRQVHVVTPDFKTAKYTSKSVSFDPKESLYCPLVEDDTHFTELFLKPRSLFLEEEYGADRLDVFGRTTSFLPKLEFAHSDKNASALAQTLEEELFDPFFTDDFYPRFDPLAMGDEQNDVTSFEVPPSLVSFYSDFSKKASTFSSSCNVKDKSTADPGAKKSFHPLSDKENDDEMIIDWMESGDPSSQL